MCRLRYGTGSWSSASSIPAKWQSMNDKCSGSYSLAVSSYASLHFSFCGKRVCRLRRLIHSGKQKLKAHVHCRHGDTLSIAHVFFICDLIFWQSRHIYGILLIFERLLRRRKSSYLFPSQGAYNTLLSCDRLTLDLSCEGSVKTRILCKFL